MCDWQAKKFAGHATSINKGWGMLVAKWSDDDGKLLISPLSIYKMQITKKHQNFLIP